ncbi:P-II family nitrogen regulator [Acidaminobacterium chupaoyuni]
MKLMVLILNRVELLDDLLEKFMKEGISGATILQSRGMAHQLFSNASEDPGFLGSLKALLDPEREENLTILTVVKDEMVAHAVEVIEDVVGDLKRPDTGIVFTVPVDFMKGIQ